MFGKMKSAGGCFAEVVLFLRRQPRGQGSAYRVVEIGFGAALAVDVVDELLSVDALAVQVAALQILKMTAMIS